MNNNIFTFHKTVIGYRHIQEEIPCQDSSTSYTAEDGSFQIIAVGDGHGDPACHRSSKGSKYAVTFAEQCLKEFAKAICSGDMDISSPRQKRECIEQLTNTIISKWYGAIRNDLLQNEVNEDDLKEAGPYTDAYREGRRLEHLYGTTLLAALRVTNYFVFIHQGDGRCDVFYDDGSVDQPIPWDNRCKGSITTSMCDEDVFGSIRSVVINTDERKVVACYIGSDGVEDSYYDNEESQMGTHRFYMDLSCKIHELNPNDFLKYLDDYLPEFSRTGSVDDVSVAGIIDLNSIAALFDIYKEKVEKYDYKESLEKRLTEANSKLISMTRKHDFLKQRSLEAEVDLDKALKEKQKLIDALSQLRSKRDELSKEADATKDELEIYRREAQEARRSVEEKYHSLASAIRAFVDEITVGYSRKEADYSQMLEQLMTYNQQLEEQEDKISEQNDTIKECQTKLDEANAEYEVYHTRYCEIETELQQVQDEIKKIS